jgi:glutamate N-acetyltransferase / amino-acid N-acetyltransferase
MPVSKPDLDAVFRRCVTGSLNAITIDGDMSTNDTALILAPCSGNPAAGKDIEAFEEALAHVLRELAEMLVRDGEGATKFITVTVTGARSEDDARSAARTICESLLVKTALFGRDPNWGRIACAAGYSGAEVREESLTITIGGTSLLINGKPQPYDRPRLIDALGAKDISVIVDLGTGRASAVFRTCDISYDYVKINAEYTT